MIRPRLNRIPADPDEAAAWWSARRRLGLTTAREDEAFAEWLADPVNGIAWEATEGPIEAVGVYAALPEMRELREAALSVRRSPSQTFWRWAAGGAIAASLIAGFLFLAGPPLLGPGAEPTQVAATSVERFTTQIGERRLVRLSDGSRVDLNTGSVMEVAYSPGRRDVRLLGGQALFRVAHDANRPFVVAAGDRRIMAVGTEFDVRLGDRGAVIVTLVEGRVRVESIRRQETSSAARAAPVEMLEAGQRLAMTNGNVRIATADIERETSWTRGQVIFRDDRMAEAITEVNRYSTARLVVNDPRVANLRVSGAFAAGSTENFVAAVTSFFPVEARRESPGVTVLEWRESGG